MWQASDIHKNMEVVGSCSNHVGVVDAVEDQSIQLMRKGDDAEGIHHFLPLDWVTSVGQTVRLNKSRDEVRKQWHLEPFATSVKTAS